MMTTCLNHMVNFIGRIPQSVQWLGYGLNDPNSTRDRGQYVQLPIQWITRALPSGGKRQSIAEVKKALSYSLTPLICLYGVVLNW